MIDDYPAQLSCAPMQIHWGLNYDYRRQFLASCTWRYLFYLLQQRCSSLLKDCSYRSFKCTAFLLLTERYAFSLPNLHNPVYILCKKIGKIIRYPQWENIIDQYYASLSVIPLSPWHHSFFLHHSLVLLSRLPITSDPVSSCSAFPATVIQDCKAFLDWIRQ